MGSYRRRSEVVEAFQYTGNPNNPGWPDGWFSISLKWVENHLPKGDWYLKRENGTVARLSDESFREIYEPIPPAEEPK